MGFFNFDLHSNCQTQEKPLAQKEISYFDVLGQNVKLEVVKPAEDGNGVILRFYEYYGTETEICFIASEPWVKLIETDLMENDQYIDSRNTIKTKLDFKPYEIRTFRLNHS